MGIFHQGAGRRSAGGVVNAGNRRHRGGIKDTASDERGWGPYCPEGAYIHLRGHKSFRVGFEEQFPENRVRDYRQ